MNLVIAIGGLVLLVALALVIGGATGPDVRKTVWRHVVHAWRVLQERDRYFRGR